ncbi:MAG: hypothetical protein HY369_00490 [Candidatus Aenigmarchaeota archaeon]|nr:hypothetical protein [Candidatus Aenigmarchaeota archaeon]
MTLGRPPLFPIDPNGPHVLRKYCNRRCYDPRTGRYTNFPEILRLAARDPGLAIIDARTGEDLTAYVLLSALKEVADRVPVSEVRRLCGKLERARRRS